ncbi:hypothetical protein O3M35_005410 [Rhynocoris fuscipes]|uniref:Uncharacterized protein n=1 Tax=Rhynocoris fuscipes TaxID=488301 RepID=A0AAW1DKB4_9HEMI
MWEPEVPVRRGGNTWSGRNARCHRAQLVAPPAGGHRPSRRPEDEKSTGKYIQH